MSSELDTAAQEWLERQDDPIEIFERYIPFENMPENAGQSWVASHGAESDSAVGFVLQPLTSESGASGVALITAKGTSWEGIRYCVEQTFGTEAEAREWISRAGYIL